MVFVAGHAGRVSRVPATVLAKDSLSRILQQLHRAAHRVIMPSVVHDTTRYANNRAEVSHQSTRRRERQRRRFKSLAHAQRFLAVHDVVRNLFTVGRHRLRAGHQRLLRSRAFVTWNAVAAA